MPRLMFVAALAVCTLTALVFGGRNAGDALRRATDPDNQGVVG
jgi:hypothetical protein